MKTNAFNPEIDSVMDKPHEASELIDELVAALREMVAAIDATGMHYSDANRAALAAARAAIAAATGAA